MEPVQVLLAKGSHEFASVKDKDSETALAIALDHK